VVYEACSRAAAWWFDSERRVALLRLAVVPDA
jgi:hypothetical protein